MGREAANFENERDLPLGVTRIISALSKFEACLDGKII